MIVVCGGGIIGLAIAWRVAQAGLDVTVVDPEPGMAASRAAAGLLCPVFEARPGEEALLGLNLASYQRWPAFATELEQASGTDIGLRATGTLAVAFDGDDLRQLEDLRRFQERLDLPVARLTRRECRQLEPLLSPRLRGGVRFDSESSVDPRRTCDALVQAARSSGARHVSASVAEVELQHGRAVGVRLDDGERIDATQVVIALGPWSAAVAGLPRELRPPVRPVKGQILRLRFDPADPPISRNLHGLARGHEIYLVPRTDGELVVGATVEEQGFDTAVTAGAVRDVLEAAIDVLPVVAELEQVEAMARLRPGTPDNAPIIGPTPVDGLILATGHYRNGILLAPVTADGVAALLVDGKLPPEAEPFTLERFT